ncbi:MAG: hypothetical protein LUQ60_00100 [Methanomicrobiales archaeon]|nr:hypothetical protein [Methanomicrobiales archaeon]
MNRLVTFQDTQVLNLYILAREPGEILISDDQKVAIELLGSLAHKGNRDAMGALAALLRSPDLHPMLREMVAAETGFPVQTGI